MGGFLFLFITNDPKGYKISYSAIVVLVLVFPVLLRRATPG